MNEAKAPFSADGDQLCVNTIRTLVVDAIETAGSGHPGAAMALAPAAYVLWCDVLKHCPEKADWLDRDRFVLSGGHASMLLYSLLYLTGYGISLADIKDFRQWGSKTPGHPEFGRTPGVETTTGPLGQGFANGVGMAMAERHLAARFNRPGYDIVNHFTYVMCGDGDMMEGLTAEAASLAGHLGLGRLICLYDDNGICIEGRTDTTFTEDVPSRFTAYRWQVLTVDDGNDLSAIARALAAAKAETHRPSLIVLKTHIACGSPNLQDSAQAHGAPLGRTEAGLTKECLGFPSDQTFFIPEAALKTFRTCVEKGRRAESLWQENFREYAVKFPDLADGWINAVSGFLASDWSASLPVFSPAAPPLATRKASGQVLNALAEKLPTLMGGSADLAPSTQTLIASSHDFQAGRYDGRNIRFGVREHAMGGIMNGMFLHHGIRPFGGTFLVFADYMRPAIRMACLMRLAVIYVLTHDSIAVGQDGPTHQPVEHLAALRAMPGLTVIRPADANETVAAWRAAVRANGGPVALILSRQKLPILDASGAGGGVANGAYVLSDPDGAPDLILMASGAEVHLARDAAGLLAEKGIGARVVSMPSWELFQKQSRGYRDSVLPPSIPVRVAVEAGSPMGWERYTGDRGTVIGIDRFGASAPGETNLKKFGFTAAHVADRALWQFNRQSGGAHR